MTTMTMTPTPFPVDNSNSNSSYSKVTMMNQPEEDESTALLAPVATADHGQKRAICGVMKKKKAETPCFSFCKIHLFRSSVNTTCIETHENTHQKQESSVAETCRNYFREHHQPPHQEPKPQFVLIHGAEIV
jgi:hypothetical protein